MTTQLIDVPADIARPSHPADMIGDWMVAQVYRRNESTVADQLTRLGIQTYLPIAEQVYYDSQNKKRRRLSPLIPGYLFVCTVDAGEVYDVMSLRTICGRAAVYGRIEVRNQPRLVRELSDLHTALGHYDCQAWGQPAVGALCRIIAGPLMGKEGVVVSIGKRRQFVLQVTNLLGEGAVALEIEPELLEAV